MDDYLTIAGPASGIFKDRGSKFLSYAYPVISKEEIKEHLNNLRKMHYDARHICYAYRLDETTYRTSDDGEPMHSAGDPIWGRLQSKNVLFTLVAVVRYFGGTKLGVPGLINAYKTAADIALNNAELVEKYYTIDIKVTYNYDQTSTVERLIASFNALIKEQTYMDKCQLVLSVRDSLSDNFINNIPENIHYELI